jgi:hypothetical protein
LPIVLTSSAGDEVAVVAPGGNDPALGDESRALNCSSVISFHEMSRLVKVIFSRGGVLSVLRERAWLGEEGEESAQDACWEAQYGEEYACWNSNARPKAGPSTIPDVVIVSMM